MYSGIFLRNCSRMSCNELLGSWIRAVQDGLKTLWSLTWDLQCFSDQYSWRNITEIINAKNWINCILTQQCAKINSMHLIQWINKCYEAKKRTTCFIKLWLWYVHYFEISQSRKYLMCIVHSKNWQAASLVHCTRSET